MKGGLINMMTVEEAYAIFKENVPNETLEFVSEADDVYQFDTVENTDGVYYVYKDDGKIELEPFWHLFLQPKNIINNIDIGKILKGKTA